MRILIYGINFSPELTGIGKYTGEMASWLADQKHSVRVVTAPPYYPEWKVAEGYSNKKYSRTTEGNIEIIRCPLFIPSKITTLSRLGNLFSFSLSSSLPILSSFYWKPDIIIQVVPSLFCSLQTLLLAKIRGTTSIVHIQDYEVDAMFGLSMLKNGLIKKLAFWAEHKILNSFDYVSSISEGMINRALSKGVHPEKLVFFPNWSELDHFRNANRSEKFLIKLGINPNKKIVLYSGNMGKKQGLNMVIKAAKKMSINRDIHFVMVGDGAAKLELQSLANDFSLKNITFLPLVSHEKLPELLASADCHLVVQKSGAADSVMPSKLTNILAVGGNAIITASETTTLGELCMKHPGIATLVDPDSISALVDGIKLTLTMSKPNQIAKQYANLNLDQDIILRRFLKEVSYRKNNDQ